MKGPIKVTDRIFQVAGPDQSWLNDCQCFLIDIGNGKAALVDSGTGEALDALLKNCSTVGFEPQDIDHLILTHCHIDHVGGAPELKKICNLQIIAHELDRNAIEGKNNKRTAADWYDLDYHGVLVDDVMGKDNMAHVDVLEKPDEVRLLGEMELRFIHTPGHTPGSMVVVVQDEGKLVLFGQDIHGPFADAFGSDIKQWRRSMERLLELEADILCEGHFGVFRGKKRVAAFIRGQLGQHK